MTITKIFTYDEHTGECVGRVVDTHDANEIEVTPEMIEAGRLEIAKVWLEFISDGGDYIWDEVLTSVYRAMHKATPMVPNKMKIVYDVEMLPATNEIVISKPYRL